MISVLKLHITRFLYVGILIFSSLYCYTGYNDAEKKAVSSDREIVAAYEYLNKVRTNPDLYAGELGVESKDINFGPSQPLTWNEKLARSAQKKAEDMAARNYFSHIDPDGFGPNYLAHREGYNLPDIYDKSYDANNIESISAATFGSDGIGHIKRLIKDEGVADLGHRKQLLGLTEFFAKQRHIGIGMAYSETSEYKYYFVVHTAVDNDTYKKYMLR